MCIFSIWHITSTLQFLDYCSIFRNQPFEQHSQGLQVCLINLNHVVCVSCLLSCSIGLSAFITHHKMRAAIYWISFPVTVSWLDVLSDCRRSSLGWTWALVNYVKRSKSIKSLLVRRFVRWIFSCEDALQTTQLSFEFWMLLWLYVINSM
jgi:hypothetical protein